MEPLVRLKLLLPRIPLIVKIALLNKLGFSPAARLQDTKVEVVVGLIRSILERRVPLSRAQTASLYDPGIKGQKWIAKCVFPPCEDDTDSDEIPDVRLALAGAISELGDGNESYALPQVQEVEAEWTGYRSDVGIGASRPNLWEQEHYKMLMADDNLTSDTTILYLHGGAYVGMDPASHRDGVTEICRQTHGRALSVRYRLAPQNPFPAALLDAFIAYLSLLYPPDGSFHEPVKASDIIFSGDSAGGGICVALMLVLLTLRRIGVDQVRFHGEDVELLLPGGAALISPWLDVSRSMPSVYRNAKYDYIAPPSKAESVPPVPVNLPPDDIWPSKPPRVEQYCDATMVIHPLVSPIAAKKQLWEGHPPVWISTGSEGLQDEALILAQRLTQTGICVVEVFEGMPHVFPFMFREQEWSKEWFRDCTTFCTAFTSGDERLKSTSRWWTKPRGPATFDLDRKVAEFVGEEEDIDDRLLRGQDWRIREELDMLQRWRGSVTPAASNAPARQTVRKNEQKRIDEFLTSGAL